MHQSTRMMVRGAYRAITWLITASSVHESTAKAGREEPEPPSLHDPAMPVISQISKFMINLQLTVIFFLAFCWLYERVVRAVKQIIIVALSPRNT